MSRTSQGGDAAAGPLPPRAPSPIRYPSYFERQVEARCGMHALNNALGQPLHDNDDMQRACAVYLSAARQEGSAESRALHVRQGGWYSSEVMAQAVTTTALEKLGRVAHVIQLQPLHVAPAALQTSIGAIVNLDNVHWVALRWIDDQIWFLDSLEPRPVPLTWSAYTCMIQRHKDCASSNIGLCRMICVHNIRLAN